MYNVLGLVGGVGRQVEQALALVVCVSHVARLAAVLAERRRLEIGGWDLAVSEVETGRGHDGVIPAAGPGAVLLGVVQCNRQCKRLQKEPLT